MPADHAEGALCACDHTEGPCGWYCSCGCNGPGGICRLEKAAFAVELAKIEAAEREARKDLGIVLGAAQSDGSQEVPDADT